MGKFGKKLGPTGTIVFGLAFAVIGLLLVIFGIVKLVQAGASSSWPSVKGTVVSCKVQKGDSKGRGGRRGRKNRRSSRYYASVSYEYSVDGKQDVGDKISYGTVGGTRAKANEKAKQYAQGSQVDVYYNPDNPADAVLEAGQKASIYTLPGVGAFFAMLGSGFAVYGFTGRK